VAPTLAPVKAGGYASVMSDALPVTLPEIEAAAARIAFHVRRTPCLDAEPDLFGPAQAVPVSLKLEFLQHAGSFKPRGAFNTLLQGMVPAAGVAAASGGNHGAAVAYAASRLGYRATIFVPEIASPVKIARIRSFGAEVRVGGARYADALAACEAFIAATGALSVHAYDAAPTIAGQGTLGLEWIADRPDLDTVLVAVGGGGLIAGIAAALAGRVKVVGVEPEGSRCLHAALEAGHPVDVPVESVAADSLGARRTGDLVLAIARHHVDRIVLVPDAAIVAAQHRLWDRLRVASEPGGAAAFAALAGGFYPPDAGERVGVLLCGANVDPSIFGTSPM
jgi:threonine dehydratase